MILNQCNNHPPGAQALIIRIKTRAGNLYQTRQFLCAESVVVTLNSALNGGLSDTQAVAVAAPFSIAMGESGCICGALSGAVLASGLFIGNDQTFQDRRYMRKSAHQLHDTFKSAHGSTCCRALCRNVRHDSQAHFQQCAAFTANAAEMAARLILNERPDLIQCADNTFLTKTDTKLSGFLKSLFRMIPLPNRKN